MVASKATKEMHVTLPVFERSMRSIAQSFSDLDGRLDVRFAKIDERFNKIDQRFDAIDKRLESIDQRFNQINERFESVDQRFGAFDERFDGLENRMNAGFTKIDGTLVLILGELRNMHTRQDEQQADIREMKRADWKRELSVDNLTERIETLEKKAN